MNSILKKNEIFEKKTQQFIGILLMTAYWIEYFKPEWSYHFFSICCYLSILSRLLPRLYDLHVCKK